MSCKPKCWSTAAIHGPSGRRLMISKGGPGSKFPAETHHGMCDECIQEMLQECDRQLGSCLSDRSKTMEKANPSETKSKNEAIIAATNETLKSLESFEAENKTLLKEVKPWNSAKGQWR